MTENKRKSGTWSWWLGSKTWRGRRKITAWRLEGEEGYRELEEEGSRGIEREVPNWFSLFGLYHAVCFTIIKYVITFIYLLLRNKHIILLYNLIVTTIISIWHCQTMLINLLHMRFRKKLTFHKKSLTFYILLRHVSVGVITGSGIHEYTVVKFRRFQKLGQNGSRTGLLTKAERYGCRDWRE